MNPSSNQPDIEAIARDLVTPDLTISIRGHPPSIQQSYSALASALMQC